jgi:hypothetical protein
MPSPRLSITALLVAGLCVSTPALASALPRKTPPSRAEIAKRAACERVWAAQRVRHGSRQAFVAACVAKG